MSELPPDYEIHYAGSGRQGIDYQRWFKRGPAFVSRQEAVDDAWRDYGRPLVNEDRNELPEGVILSDGLGCCAALIPPGFVEDTTRETAKQSAWSFVNKIRADTLARVIRALEGLPDLAFGPSTHAPWLNLIDGIHQATAYLKKEAVLDGVPDALQRMLLAAREEGQAEVWEKMAHEWSAGGSRAGDEYRENAEICRRRIVALRSHAQEDAT